MIARPNCMEVSMRRRFSDIARNSVCTVVIWSGLSVQAHAHSLECMSHGYDNPASGPPIHEVLPGIRASLEKRVASALLDLSRNCRMCAQEGAIRPTQVSVRLDRDTHTVVVDLGVELADTALSIDDTSIQSFMSQEIENQLCGKARFKGIEYRYGGKTFDEIELEEKRSRS